MKAVTGNRLVDGRVVYLDANHAWMERIREALLLDTPDAELVLVAAKDRIREVASAYLIEVDGDGPSGREALRERIRATGPTVGSDNNREARR